MKRRSRRRRRRPWLFMVATWSKSRSYRRNGQIGREGENERAGVKRMGHPVRGRECCCLDDFCRGDLQTFSVQNSPFPFGLAAKRRPKKGNEKSQLAVRRARAGEEAREAAAKKTFSNPLSPFSLLPLPLFLRVCLQGRVKGKLQRLSDLRLFLTSAILQA